MIAGDSELERRIQIGHNFPNRILAQNEMITTTDVLQLLGQKIGDNIEVNVSPAADIQWFEFKSNISVFAFTDRFASSPFIRRKKT